MNQRISFLTYHYHHEIAMNRADDFGAVVESMTSADDSVLITPVYWVCGERDHDGLFDHLTNTLGDPIGRRVSVLATGTDEHCLQEFTSPSREQPGILEWPGKASPPLIPRGSPVMRAEFRVPQRRRAYDLGGDSEPT